MGKFRLYSGLSTNLSNQPLSDGTVYLTTDDGRLYIDRTHGDSVERFLINDSNVLCRTTAEWNADSSIIAKKGTFYVYTDKVGSENCLKIGDGSAYLIDIPFVDEYILEHINNSDIHITNDERVLWNNKVTCYLDSTNDENLIFTKN